jgi:hypothetical protein
MWWSIDASGMRLGACVAGVPTSSFNLYMQALGPLNLCFYYVHKCEVPQTGPQLSLSPASEAFWKFTPKKPLSNFRSSNRFIIIFNQEVIKYVSIVFVLVVADECVRHQ